MYFFGKVTVNPQLPERISKLNDIANNVWWTWNVYSLKLFEELDPVLWKKVDKSPVRFLKEANQETLNKAAEDPEFLQKYDEVISNFTGYINNENTWFNQTYPEYKNELVAYFSAEYGLDETLPIYAGGLGILSGDHCKSASDLGIPFVAIGLLYKHGYSIQLINENGSQSYEPVSVDVYNSPILPMKDEHNNDLIINIDFLDHKLYLKVWCINVGKVHLYLLDSDIEQNSIEDREITARLYGGTRETRIAQEIVLGIGGMEALKALNIKPTIYHMNEGHAAFVGIDLIRKLMHEDNVSYNVAKEIAMSKLIFTTHTPVPAGIDIFDLDLVKKYFCNYWKYLGLDEEAFLELGQKPEPAFNNGFNMGVLAFKLAGKKNGVSKLHESVTKDLFGDIWPTLAHTELPVTHVTNGVHTCSWLQPSLKALYNKYFVPYWQDKIHIQETWDAIYNIPDEELWEIHQQQKRKLVDVAIESMHTQMVRNDVNPEEIKEIEKQFNPNALIIGFSRRFSTYKRADLIFRDLERISSILNNPEKPVMLIFSGKAHPHDKAGQDLIKTIIEYSKKPQFRGKIAFIEDYNMKIARYLVSGSDIWLNNPRRPLEASGTSGEKAAVNGVINFSILDGWWFEGYNGQNGWAIGTVDSYKTFEAQDNADAASIYDILESEIVPLYYQRDENNIPHEWITIMKNSIHSCGCQYSTQRMLIDYTNELYMPQIKTTTSENYANSEKVLDYYNWKQNIIKNWDSIEIYRTNTDTNINVDAGNNITVSCMVKTPIIPIEDLSVEVYFAKVNPDGILENITISPMNVIKTDDNTYTCDSQIQLLDGGQYGYTYRIVPTHPMLINKYDLGLIKWIKE